MPLFERLLRARGLDDDETVRRFCTPKLTDLHEPNLLPNIEPAVDRLASAVRNRESIVIYPGSEAIPVGGGTVALGLHPALDWIRDKVAR